MPEGDRWVHPAELAVKFAPVVCDDPDVGRLAKPAEIRYGRGRGLNARRERYDVHTAIPELAQPPGTPVAIGTDGSYKALVRPDGAVRKPMSWGYLATNGLFGMGTFGAPRSVVGYDRPLQGELRAIWWALDRLGPDHPVTVWTDSTDAVELMTQWRAGAGASAMPPGYTTERPSRRPATLVRLAERVHAAGDTIEVRWVRGHTGHPLNEAADELAKLARRWHAGRFGKDAAVAAARREVLDALQRYAREP